MSAEMSSSSSTSLPFGKAADDRKQKNRWRANRWLALGVGLLALAALTAYLWAVRGDNGSEESEPRRWLVLEGLEELPVGETEQRGFREASQPRQDKSFKSAAADDSKAERRRRRRRWARPTERMRFVLMCQVLDGEPPVHIKWLKEGRELANGLLPSQTGSELDEAELVQTEELGASLLFRRVQPHHSGNYTCVASNPHGQSSYSSQMSVKVAPKWRVEPQDQHSIMGEQMSIDCQATGNPNPFIRWKFQHLSSPPAGMAPSSPAAAAEWSAPPSSAASFKLINSNHHVQTLENGSLSIRQAHRDHEGLYLCEADNGVEPALVKVVRLELHQQAAFADDLQLVAPSDWQGIATAAAASSSAPVAGQPPVRALRLPVAPPNATSGAGQVRLVCQPMGDLPLTLDWLKDGQLLHTQTIGGGGGGSLATDQPDTPLDTPLARGRLHVSTRRAIGGGGGQQVASELLLAGLRRQDAGLYACAARNQFGRAERQLRLLLQEAPEPPQLLDVAHIGSRSVALRWLAPYDGNAPILRYLIEWRRLPDDPLAAAGLAWPESAPAMGHSERQVQPPTPSQGQQVQHTVHELEPLARYSMRVVAVNSLARSRPSAALSLRTEEEVPSVVPSLVEAAVLSSSRVRLRWTTSYSPAHELIDGFFVGYRSLDAPPPPPPSQQQEAQQQQQRQQLEQPTFTYKTIRLTNQDPHQMGELVGASTNQAQGGPQPDSALLAPVSSYTKTLAAPAPFPLGEAAGQATKTATGQLLVVVSSFEFEVGGLERDTEYTVLIQCFNKKGAGPTSDPLVFRTLVNDPPERVALHADEATESSIRLSWKFLSPAGRTSSAHQAPTGAATRSQAEQQPVDGFVLTYARVAQRRLAAAKLVDAANFQQAARITQQAPAAGQGSINNASLDQWQAVQLAPQQRQHQLRNLECGSAYALKMWAFNKAGNGEPSDLVTVSTRGKAPVAPDKRSFISANSTQVRLHLSAWYDGGCEIDKFVLQYRARGQQDWLLVSNNILKEQVSLVLRDLLPATGYELLVAAHNQVGPTEARYRFATLDTEFRPVQLLGPAPGELEAPEELDEYLDEGVRRQLWSDHQLVRHLLGSPLALLLSLGLFVVLGLLLLAGHRLAARTAGGARSGGGGGGGHHNKPGGRHSDLSSEMPGAPPTGCGSSLGADSPHLAAPQYPLINECQYQQSYASAAVAGGNNSCAGQLDYGQVVGHHQQHNQANDLYLAAAAAAQVNADYGQTAYANIQRQQQQQQPMQGGQDEAEQQCLMQMLMMGAGQQQQLPEQTFTLARNCSAANKPLQHYSNYHAATLRPQMTAMQQQQHQAANYQHQQQQFAAVAAVVDPLPATKKHRKGDNDDDDIPMSSLVPPPPPMQRHLSAGSATTSGSSSSASTSGLGASSGASAYGRPSKGQDSDWKVCDSFSQYDVPYKFLKL